MVTTWSIRAARIFGAGVILELFVVLAQSGELPDRPQPPAPIPSCDVTVIAKEKGKFYFCEVRLTFRNPTDRAVWYVLPMLSGNELFPYDGELTVKKSNGCALLAEEQGTKESRTVVVTCYATSISFHAVCVPPNGVLKWDRHSLCDNQPVRFMDLWVVKEVLTDGKTPMAEWLGVNLTSSENANVEKLPREKRTIAEVKMGEERQFRFIKLDPINRYVVPLPDFDNQSVQH